MSKSAKVITVIVSAVLVTALLGVFGLLIAGGAFVKKRYLQPWDTGYYQSFEEPRQQAAAHGLLAPNAHNLQPWRLSFPEAEGDTMYLYTDPDMVVAADPEYRECFYTQGAFLGYTKAAANRLGYDCQVTALIEDDGNDIADRLRTLPVAKATFTKSDTASESRLAGLYEHIYKIDVNRSPYLPLAPDAKQIEAIESLAGQGIGIQIVTEPDDIEFIGGLAVEGIKAAYGPEVMAKQIEGIFRPNEYQKNKYKYGLALEGQGEKDIKMLFSQGLLTVFPFLGSGEKDDEKAIKNIHELTKATPAYIIITDDNNTRDSQIQVGMVYSDIVLTAHSMGLVVQPVSQQIADFEGALPLKQKFEQRFAPNTNAAMLIRLGTAEKEFPQNMRKSLEDVTTA